MMRILVAGCGYVGTAVAEALARSGAEVIGIRRHVNLLPLGMRGIAADLTDLGTLDSRLPSGIEQVVFAAAPSSYDDEAYRRTYVDGVQNLLGALRRTAQPVNRLLFVSSTSVYGQRHGESVDESSPTEPLTFAGAYLLGAEREFHAHAPDAAVTARLASVYGPGRDLIIDQVRHGLAYVKPGAAHYGNRIHRDDAASALCHLLALDRPAGNYVVCDDAPAAQEEVLAWLAAQLEVPLPHVPLSAHADEPPTATNKRCSNGLLRASGWEPRYPTYREGLASLISAAVA
jgi:nucleoside-diphosphate-sugar epimerase